MRRRYAVVALVATLCLGVALAVQGLGRAYATDAPASVTITDVHHAPGWDMGYIASSGGIGYCGDKSMNYPASGGVYSGPVTARAYFGETNGRALDWVLANGYRDGHETAAGLTGDYAALATQGAVWAIIHGEAGRQGYSNPTVVAAVDTLLAGAYAYAGGDATIDGCAWVYSPYADFIQPYVLYVEQESSGSLQVKKVVQGEGADANARFRFVVTLTDSAGRGVSGTFGSHTFSGGTCAVLVSQSSPVTISGLPEGLRYSVEEDTTYNADYTLSGIEGASGVIEADRTATATGTNVRKGSLQVRKVVRGEGADADARFRFVVTLRDASGHAVSGTFGSYAFSGGTCAVLVSQNAPVTIPGIPKDYTYSVEEDTTYNTEYTLSGLTGASGTISAGGVAVATGTNDRSGNLRIRKVVTGQDADPDARFRFDVVLRNASGANVSGTFGGYTFSNGRCQVIVSQNTPATIPGIPVSYTYEVAEDTSYNARYVLTGITGASGSISSGGTVTATGTNRRSTWTLAIAKDFEGYGGQDDHVFHFDVELTDDAGHAVNGTYGGRTFSDGRCRVSLTKATSPVRITGIPTYYTYRVSEVADEDYEFKRWTTNDATASTSGRSVGGRPTEDGTAVTATCVNKRKPGYGKVVKVSTV